MKILFLLELFKPHVWWVEILFDNLINWLTQEWNKVTVLTSRFSKTLAKYEKLSDNLEIYRVWNNRYDFMFYCLAKGIKLAKKADVIHTTTYNAAIPASIIAKITWKRVIITVHEIFWKLRYKFIWRKWFFFKFFENLIFRFHFDKYICVSNYTKNSLRIRFGIDDNKLVTIYNWINYNLWEREKFKTADIQDIKNKFNLNQHYTWLFFGRPGISKWLRYYIQAIPEILKSIKQFKALLIVSESNNNPAGYEKKLIKELGIEKSIIWVPGVKYDQLWNYILACDFVIVPSLAEWFGFSAAETCSLDQQLVVSGIASLPEVVSGKINFVEPANAIDIASKAVDFYHNKYQTIEKKRFFWEDNIKKTLFVYKDISWK